MTRFIVPELPERDDPAWAPLDRYLTGVATPADLVEVERWCAERDGRRAALEQWRDAWQHLSLDQRRSAEVLDRIADQILTPEASPRPVSRRPRRGESRRSWLIPALAGLVVLAGAYRAWPTLRRLSTSGTPPAGVREVVTAKGQIASITLSDGTHVTVGVASHLTIPAEFGARNRALVLDGAALFDVAENRSAPFVVRTGASSTRVLGTTFTVRHYALDSSTAVTVMSGKVVLDSSVIAAGQEGVRAGRGPVVLRAVRDHNATAWVNGRIAFDSMPLRDVVTELNRWYGVQFVLDDPALGNEPVTVGFVGRSADEVASVLDTILGTTHRRTATQIILSR